MADSLARMLESVDDPVSLVRRREIDLAPRDAWPSINRLPYKGPYWENPSERLGDPMLGQNLKEAAAARLGRSLAHRNFGEAILSGAELAAAGFGSARGGRIGTRGGPGAAGRPTGAGAEAGRLPERGGVGGGDSRLPASGGAEHPYTPIPGQPGIIKLPGIGEVEARPIPQIQAAARDYAHSKGRPYEQAASFEPIDVERGRRIAAAYDAMKHDPTNPDVKRAYDAMIEETLGQYRELRNKGFEFTFNPPGVDPYAKSPALGYLDVRDKGTLSVFPTIEGHGSTKRDRISPEEIRNNPLLQDTGEMWRVTGGTEKQPVTVNDAFRAVHDLLGHHMEGNAFFRGPGEDRAFGHHAILYGDEAHPAIASELRGQNSWLNYGPKAEYNKGKSGADTIYADQKVGIMPPWTWQEGLPKRKPGIIDEGVPLTENLAAMLQKR